MHNKTILITGASSGIGSASAVAFAAEGAKLILCARRKDKLTTLAQQLQKQFDCQTLILPLDVSDHLAVQTGLTQLPPQWQAIDILINNAGLALGLDTIDQAAPEDWDTMIDVNIKGLLYMTRYVIKNMINRNQGHIINIGSISSRQTYRKGTVYCATKFAVRAITEGTKMDVHGTPIRVSLISPGMVKTNFSKVRFHGDTTVADTVYQGLTPLFAEDIAAAILFVANRPSHVNIPELQIFPTDQTASHMLSRGQPF